MGVHLIDSEIVELRKKCVELAISSGCHDTPDGIISFSSKVYDFIVNPKEKKEATLSQDVTSNTHHVSQFSEKSVSPNSELTKLIAVFAEFVKVLNEALIDSNSNSDLSP